MQWWQENRQADDYTVITPLSEYPYIFFLFYAQYPPEKGLRDYAQDLKIIYQPQWNQDLLSLIPDQAKHTLLLLRPEELGNVVPEKVIRLPSGEAIWKWASWDKISENQ